MDKATKQLKKKYCFIEFQTNKKTVRQTREKQDRQREKENGVRNYFTEKYKDIGQLGHIFPTLETN